MDHQTVADAVHALIGDEARLVAEHPGADPPHCGREEHVTVGVEQGTLEDAVVVARPAGRIALSERLAHVALLPGERRRADRVRDRMAAALHLGIGRHRLRQRSEGALRIGAVREVAECLLAAACGVGGGRAVGQGRAVWLEPARDRVELHRCGAAGRGGRNGSSTAAGEENGRDADGDARQDDGEARHGSRVEIGVGARLHEPGRPCRPATSAARAAVNRPPKRPRPRPVWGPL